MLYNLTSLYAPGKIGKRKPSLRRTRQKEAFLLSPTQRKSGWKQSQPGLNVWIHRTYSQASSGLTAQDQSYQAEWECSHTSEMQRYMMRLERYLRWRRDLPFSAPAQQSEEIQIATMQEELSPNQKSFRCCSRDIALAGTMTWNK